MRVTDAGSLLCVWPIMGVSFPFPTSVNWGDVPLPPRFGGALVCYTGSCGAWGGTLGMPLLVPVREGQALSQPLGDDHESVRQCPSESPHKIPG